MKMFIWIFFALIGINKTEKSKIGSSSTLISTASRSSSGVTFSDRHSSTAVTSTSLNGITETEKPTTGSSSTLTSTTFRSTSGVTFSDRQSSTAVTSTSLNGITETEKPTTGSSSTLTSTTFRSTSGVTFSDRQSSTAVTSTSLNDKSYACNTTACFAKPGCNSFNLTCQGEQKIQITSAEYRYIHNRTISASDTCCPLNINDCKANYSYTHAVVLFTRCSGKTRCSGNLAPTPEDNECKPRTDDKYIYVSYDCIPDHNILDMCQANRQASEVDIIFQGTLSTTNTTATCVCYVQSQHNIYYELIDVRLFTHVNPDSGSYTCLSSNFSINNLLIECQHSPDDKSFKYMNSPNFTGEISTKWGFSEVMWLTFTRDAKPEMVWVKLKADGNFSVNCTSSPSTTSTGTTITKQVRTSTVKKDVSSPGDTNEISTSKTLVCTGCTTSDDKDDDGKSISMIIGVVVAVIIVVAGVAVTLLIIKRRQKLHTEDNTQISELPNGLINPGNTSCKEAGDTYAEVETSTYESITDNSALTDSKPIKNSKETRRIHENETKTKNDDIYVREYDRIEFEMKDTIKSSNYDSLPVVVKKVGDDTYSHVSNKSQAVTTAKSLANDYSHCKPSSNDTLRNHDDYSHCKPNSNDTLRNDDDYSHCMPSSSTLRNDDDYSHVDLEEHCKNNQQPNTNEDSSYNHIDFDDTKHPERNEKAIVDEN